MGIFGVHMPTIYGEGEAAFYRLQEEIMKVSGDQTIFAWGLRYGLGRFLAEARHVIPDTDFHWHDRCLLAPDPLKFEGVKDLEPISVADAMETAERACRHFSSSGLFDYRLQA